MRVCLGGTFDPFHDGHKALLRAAARGATKLFVGVTEGTLAARAHRTVASFEARAKQVRDFLAAEGFRGELVVNPLHDGVGPAVSGDYDAIAVSPETIRVASKINEQRAALGKPPLRVIPVAHMLAEDLLPISGTRIAAGLIDSNGKRQVPVRIAVGSANAVKVAAVESEARHILGLDVEVRGFAVSTGVPEQPRDGETITGARNRARAAFAAWPACDYALGIEAGLVRFPGEASWLEAQACALVDASGWETHGWGPAFHYPAWVTERALRGEMVSDILGPVAKDPRIGSTTGAIGYLSKGRMDRTALTRGAVLMAFLPRIQREIYQNPPR